MSGEVPERVTADAPRPGTGIGNRIVSPVPDDIRQRVLKPYLPVSRYVTSAQFERPRVAVLPASNRPETWLRLDAECAIKDPCYIESTGHFNAVELNITYNQMIYLCLAEISRLGAVPKPLWSLEDFFQAQLPNVLITDYQAQFRRQMNSARYSSWLMIESFEVKPRRNLALLKTRCAASNDGNDANEARVNIALVDWPSA